ncbi:kinase-like domain-containing protein [Rhizophagus clarus]|uniref:Kinase-like domain-containing protein n=1 Tax=Rhizophagus clarus TaxID=94130 RepID=A0A8H3L854_9GLOM|nr:kinase-like domain-containing protein [Rhizophagus clarus]
MSYSNKDEIQMNISNTDSDINHENCYPWCKECVPHFIIEGWTSGNNDIDKFIKNTIYNAKYCFDYDGYDKFIKNTIYNAKYCYDYDGYDKFIKDTIYNTEYDDDNVYDYNYPLFLEWVPFDRFKDIKKIGEGGFAKVYSATWIDADYLNELRTHWRFYNSEHTALNFYGMTKDPETKEFMMIIKLVDQGNLRCELSSNFNNYLWIDKLGFLTAISYELRSLHKLGYFHKDFHSGNILQNDGTSFISDFGLSGPSNKQKSDDKTCGVLSSIAPEVLIKKPYTFSSDVYSFGVIMTELSSGKPPFYKRKHDACRCMDANPDQRPTIIEINDIIHF